MICDECQLNEFEKFSIFSHSFAEPDEDSAIAGNLKGRKLEILVFLHQLTEQFIRMVNFNNVLPVSKYKRSLQDF